MFISCPSFQTTRSGTDVKRGIDGASVVVGVGAGESTVAGARSCAGSGAGAVTGGAAIVVSVDAGAGHGYRRGSRGRNKYVL